jgi:hypothetical protein
MRHGFLASALLLGLAVAGCSNRTALDDEIRGRVGEEELRRLQLYVSSDIQLWRVLRSEETGVTANHTLRIDRDRRMEEVLITAGTPGVIIKAEKKRLEVSFEAPVNGQEVTLAFQVDRNGDNQGYFLYPDKMSETGEMLVNYAGKIYIATPESRVSHLEVDHDKVKVSSHDVHEAPGRRLKDEAPQK